MRGSKGFKKRLLLQSWANGAEDGGDAGGAQEESGCFFVERSDSGSEEYSKSGFSLDGFNFNEAVNEGVASEEFMLSQTGG